MLSRSDIYSVVAEVDGGVVGSNFLWEGDTIAGVGPITVIPDSQNSVRRTQVDGTGAGAGQGSAPCRGQVGPSCLSQPFAFPLLQVGFLAREPLTILQGPPLNLELPGYQVRTATPDDLEACDELCHHVHGHDRHNEVAHAIRDGTATVVEHGARITGYATRIGFFAHAVAQTNEELKALIGAAPAFDGPGFLLPTRNAELLRWCLAQGLRVVQPMTLMSRGLYQKPAGAFLPSILY
jgi:hypothetical protein